MEFKVRQMLERKRSDTQNEESGARAVERCALTRG